MSLSCRALSTLLGILELNCKRFGCLLLLAISICGGASGVCPTACICASDIVSCTNKNLSMVPRSLFKFIKRLDLSYNKIGFLDPDWVPLLFDKLNTLILSHNTVSSISTGSFASTPNLKYLDLSSNHLRILSNPVFQELKALEVLLLYNNQITHIESGAFGGLHRLQKLYLSRNSIAYFPVDLYAGRMKLPELVLLDMSYNQLQAVPVQQISIAPARQLSGIYLHGNPFVCDCAFNSMLNFWFHRHFSPVVDFKNEYTCFLQPEAKSPTKLPLIQENFLNCSDTTVNSSFHAFGFVYEAQVGTRLVVHCDSKIIDTSTYFIWVSPDSRLLEPDSTTDNFQVFYNGSLEIKEAQYEDSGVYSCIAINRRKLLNETIDIRITVGNFTTGRSHAHEAFNTAFTTLAACVVSIILVLLYLYLTPCRCRCKTRRQPKKQSQNSAHSSILSATPLHEAPSERKSSTGKRVVFLEPIKEPMHGQNGKVRLFPSDHLMAESILKPNRVKSDSDSVSSVFSDAPVIAPV